MSTVGVRYIVHDVDAAVSFYCDQLGFDEVMHPPPPPDVRSVVSGRHAARVERSRWGPGGGQTLPDGRASEPGGWNRFQLEVSDLEGTVRRLREQGATFRSDVVRGVGGNQILLEDPAGNPIELFEPTRPEARLSES